MSTTNSPDAVTCTNCGFIDQGNYCSNCGAELRPIPQGVAGVATQDVLGLSRHRGILSTFFRILRSPVKATIELVDDVTYRGHRAFFIFGLGLFVVMLSFMSPPDTAAPARDLSSQGSLIIELLQRFSSELRYVYFLCWYLLLFITGYLIFPRLATTPRSAGEYWKLFCIFYGFSFFLILLALAPFIAVTVAVKFKFVEPSMQVSKLAAGAVAIVSLGIFLYVFIYNLIVQRPFWGISLWKATLGVFVSGLLSSIIMRVLVLALNASVNYLARV